MSEEANVVEGYLKDVIPDIEKRLGFSRPFFFWNGDATVSMSGLSMEQQKAITANLSPRYTHSLNFRADGALIVKNASPADLRSYLVDKPVTFPASLIKPPVVKPPIQNLTKPVASTGPKRFGYGRFLDASNPDLSTEGFDAHNQHFNVSHKQTGGWIASGEQACFPTSHLSSSEAALMEKSLKAGGFTVTRGDVGDFKNAFVVSHPVSGHTLAPEKVQWYMQDYFAQRDSGMAPYAKKYAKRLLQETPTINNAAHPLVPPVNPPQHLPPTVTVQTDIPARKVPSHMEGYVAAVTEEAHPVVPASMLGGPINEAELGAAPRMSYKRVSNPELAVLIPESEVALQAPKVPAPPTPPPKSTGMPQYHDYRKALGPITSELPERGPGLFKRLGGLFGGGLTLGKNIVAGGVNHVVRPAYHQVSSAASWTRHSLPGHMGTGVSIAHEWTTKPALNAVKWTTISAPVHIYHGAQSVAMGGINHVAKPVLSTSLKVTKGAFGGLGNLAKGSAHLSSNLVLAGAAGFGLLTLGTLLGAPKVASARNMAGLVEDDTLISSVNHTADIPYAEPKQEQSQNSWVSRLSSKQEQLGPLTRG